MTILATYFGSRWSRNYKQGLLYIIGFQSFHSLCHSLMFELANQWLILYRSGESNLAATSRSQL